MMEPLSLHYNTRMGKENPLLQVPKIGVLGGLRLIFSNKSRIALSQSRHPCVCFMETKKKMYTPVAAAYTNKLFDLPRITSLRNESQHVFYLNPNVASLTTAVSCYIL